MARVGFVSGISFLLACSAPATREIVVVRESTPADAGAPLEADTDPPQLPIVDASSDAGCSVPTSHPTGTGDSCVIASLAADEAPLACPCGLGFVYLCVNGKYAALPKVAPAGLPGCLVVDSAGGSIVCCATVAATRFAANDGTCPADGGASRSYYFPPGVPLHPGCRSPIAGYACCP